MERLDRWEADIVVKTPAALLRFEVKGIAASTPAQAREKMLTQARRLSGAKRITEIDIKKIRKEGS